jgi:hypothetical protein
MASIRDVFFRQFYNFNLQPYQAYDESASLHLVPYYYLISWFWKHGQLPFWNPYCGWGMPLLGDIESAPFSPWRLLFSIYPCMRWLNLLLVLELIACSVSAFILARKFKCSHLASLFTALTYTLCPFNLFNLELITGTSACLLPVVCLAFLNLAQGTIARSIFWAALACTVLIISGHPEMSFTGMVAASLFYISNVAANSKRDAILSSLTNIVVAIAVVGIATACLAAPVLLPFAEFLANSSCYKAAVQYHIGLPWQTLIYNLLLPACKWTSSYIGAAVIPLLFCAFSFKPTRTRLLSTIVPVLAVLFLLANRPFIFELSPALRLIPGAYYLPAILLFTTLAAACGLDCLPAASRSVIVKSIIAGVLFQILAPQVLKFAGVKLSAPPSTFSSAPGINFAPGDWLQSVVFSLLIACLFLIPHLFKKDALYLRCLLVIISTVSILLPAKKSLPVEPKFEYIKSEQLDFLSSQNKRSMGLGFDVLSPNNNLVYRIPNIGVHAVVMPDRYMDFMEAAGARITLFNTLIDSIPLSPLLDVAGVKYVVSLSPIFAAGDPLPAPAKVSTSFPVSFSSTKDIKLENASLRYDLAKAEIYGTAYWSIKKDTDRYQYIVSILDAKGQPLWFGGMYDIKPGATLPLVGLVPASTPPSTKFCVTLKVLDKEACRFLNPEVRLQTFTTPAANQIANTANAHFRLLSEDPKQHIRIYENLKACPENLIVHNTVHASSKQEALSILMSRSFNPSIEAIVEGSSPQLSGGSYPKDKDNISIDKWSPNSITLKTFTSKSGYLVHNCNYFSGWKAMIDGRILAPIHRVDYLFQGILLPAGLHTVQLSYEPSGFKLGVVLCFLTLFLFVLKLSRKSNAHN